MKNSYILVINMMVDSNWREIWYGPIKLETVYFEWFRFYITMPTKEPHEFSMSPSLEDLNLSKNL